jgi:hypothetical protein
LLENPIEFGHLDSHFRLSTRFFYFPARFLSPIVRRNRLAVVKFKHKGVIADSNRVSASDENTTVILQMAPQYFQLRLKAAPYNP